MTMTTCLRCEGSISSEAISCPHCGRSTNDSKSLDAIVNPQPRPNQSLVHPKESILFKVCLVISVCTYLGFLWVIKETWEDSYPMLIYLASWIVLFQVLHGLLIGNLKGNNIQVTERQFPDLHKVVTDLSEGIGLEVVPEVYIQQSGGILNAFATRFLGRNFVVINSDILELAYQGGESAVRFIVAHELGHIERKHVARSSLIMPARLIPFLGKAYSRGREYTCDRFGAYYGGKGSVDGLLILAAGKKLYTRVDIEEFTNQSIRNESFWTWFSGILSTHPHLPDRLAALKEVDLLR